MKISKQINKLFFGLSFLFLSCGQTEKLPILGPRETVEINGKVDTIYHQIPDFSLINQDSLAYGTKDLEGKVFVADFFFTTCPTICPVMKTQLLRVHEKFKEEEDFKIISISIDPNYDKPSILKDFSNKLAIDNHQWNFLTGDQAKIFELGEKEFLVTAQKDENELGGYLHSGAFLLIDRNRRIRGIYDGTQEDQVNDLIRDIERVKSGSRAVKSEN
jgi:protein SCO1/2